MLRVVRGMGALAALLAGLFGVPTALVVLGGNPFPATVSWASVRLALFTPDDGTILVGLITLVGWVAWLIFASSVLSELVVLLSGRRIRVSLPGLAGPQRMVAGLLVSVLALLVVPQIVSTPLPSSADTTHGPAGPTAPADATVPRDGAGPALAARRTGPDDQDQETTGPSRGRPVTVTAPTGSAPADSSQLTHVVATGDDLWTLAERYYGEGRDWRKIAAANPQLLTGGPDRLQPGWRLTVPGIHAPPPEDDHRHVTVADGDTLARIAERELGSEARWPSLYRANRSQLSDPDELTTGMTLALPLETGEMSAAPTAEGESRAQDESGAEVGSGAEDGAGAEVGSGAEAEAEDEAAPQQPAEEGERPAPSPEGPSVRPVPSAEPAAPPPVGSTAPRDAQPPTGPTVDQPSAPTAIPVPVPGPSGSAEAPEGVVLPLAGVSGLLAAGLLGGLAARRRIQLQSRPVGRRIAQPPAAVRPVETALGRRQRPLSLRTLDRASRAVAAHCLRANAPLPPLLYALVGESELELVMAGHAPDAPVGFAVRGRSWLLDQSDAGYLSSIPGLSEAPRPWPTLVTLGRDDQQRMVVADLEALGLLALESPDDDPPEGVISALAVELSFSPWADDMSLTLLGDSSRLPEALGKHNVTRTDDVEGLLARLEQRAAAQREHQPPPVHYRIDPDLADAWAPEIVLVNAPLSTPQRRRLEAVVTAEPRVTIAAVVVDGAAEAPWSLTLTGFSAGSGILQPIGLPLTPQYLDRPSVAAVVELVAATGSELTTPAQWWVAATEPPGPPPDNVTYLGKRFGGWDDDDEQAEGARTTMAFAGGNPPHPTLQLLGPIDLLGAAGSPPPRAAKQCLEYCAWLLEHPGTTAQAMAAALIVAEGTRRSNMSRLRGWLGSDLGGQPYLPDAYTGRIVLDPAVSSDWHQLQILAGAGVNRSSTESLRAALNLVRGAPLADAAPGQWHWAEELRTDMISCLRDIGVELATRALDGGDVDLARWAAARALVAAPGDELLMAARIRTEHLAGNPAETERLTLQLAAQARALGVDLDETTVILLQQVMEGRVRARMA